MGAYAPAQWSAVPAQVSITVPPQPGSTSVTAPDNGASLPGASASLDNYSAAASQNALNAASYTVYVFDAVLSIDHNQTLEKTKHPVQTGADISSHAYLMPASVTLDIGMSDVMAAYTGVNAQGISASAFSGSASKSVSAYQTLLQLQASRSLLTVTTRLRTYTNMLITSLPPREDYRTITGLRCRVEFEEILTGSVSTSPVTARPDATQSNGLGVVDPSTVPASTEAQFSVTPVAPDTSTTNPLTTPAQLPPLPDINGPDSVGSLYNIGTVNGAGSYSSSPTIPYEPY